MSGLENSRWASSPTPTPKATKTVTSKPPAAVSIKVSAASGVLMDSVPPRSSSKSPGLQNSRWAAPDTVPVPSPTYSRKSTSIKSPVPPSSILPIKSNKGKDGNSNGNGQKIDAPIITPWTTTSLPTRLISTAPIVSMPCPKNLTRTSHSQSPRKHPLGDSSVAIRPATTTPATALLARNARENFDRFLRIVARLKWKHPALQAAYRAALEAPVRGKMEKSGMVKTDKGWLASGGMSWADMVEEEDAYSPVVEVPVHGGEHVVEPHAGDMFKLDFFEYYGLLEGAVVHLMAIFNEDVRREPADGDAGSVKTSGKLINSRHATSAAHSYHRDVLKSLAASPSLGPLLQKLVSKPRNNKSTQIDLSNSMAAFQLAKILRNRWKLADVEGELNDMGRDLTLGSFDFEEMLQLIFAFFDQAYVLVLERNREERRRREEAAKRKRQEKEKEGQIVEDWPMEMDLDGDLVSVAEKQGVEGDIRKWDFLDSVMDWEGVVPEGIQV